MQLVASSLHDWKLCGKAVVYFMLRPVVPVYCPFTLPCRKESETTWRCWLEVCSFRCYHQSVWTLCVWPCELLRLYRRFRNSDLHCSVYSSYLWKIWWYLKLWRWWILRYAIVQSGRKRSTFKRNSPVLQGGPLSENGGSRFLRNCFSYQCYTTSRFV